MQANMEQEGVGQIKRVNIAGGTGFPTKEEWERGAADRERVRARDFPNEDSWEICIFAPGTLGADKVSDELSKRIEDLLREDFPEVLARLADTVGRFLSTMGGRESWTVSSLPVSQ